MKIKQIDISVNDFVLRIKDNGEWVRLDTSMTQEGDDFCLDFGTKDEIIALCQLKEKYRREYDDLYGKIVSER